MVRATDARKTVLPGWSGWGRGGLPLFHLAKAPVKRGKRAATPGPSQCPLNWVCLASPLLHTTRDGLPLEGVPCGTSLPSAVACQTPRCHPLLPLQQHNTLLVPPHCSGIFSFLPWPPAYCHVQHADLWPPSSLTPSSPYNLRYSPCGTNHRRNCSPVSGAPGSGSHKWAFVKCPRSHLWRLQLPSKSPGAAAVRALQVGNVSGCPLSPHLKLASEWHLHQAPRICHLTAPPAPTTPGRAFPPKPEARSPEPEVPEPGARGARARCASEAAPYGPARGSGQTQARIQVRTAASSQINFGQYGGGPFLMAIENNSAPLLGHPPLPASSVPGVPTPSPSQALIQSTTKAPSNLYSGNFLGNPCAQFDLGDSVLIHQRPWSQNFLPNV